MNRLRAVGRRLSKLFDQVRRAVRYKSLPAQVFEVCLHKARINTHPADYYLFEFYKGDKTWEQKSRYVGDVRGSRYWPYEACEFKYNIFFTNKYIQKQILAGLGLPISRLMAAVGTSYEVRDQPQFEAFLDTVRNDFAIKPISGAGGHGVLLLKNDCVSYSAAGRAYSRQALWEHVSRDLRNGYLVEERIYNSPQLADLYPVSLNTFRVILIKTRDGSWHLAACYLKAGRGGSQVDNRSSGGLLILLDESGNTVRAWDPVTRVHVSCHPDTGRALIGIRLQGYRAVVDLAFQAARAMIFTGTVGLDIADSARGPVVIEANVYWAAAYIQIAMGRGIVDDELARSLPRHHMFSRWDRNRLYPGFHLKKR